MVKVESWVMALVSCCVLIIAAMWLTQDLDTNYNTHINSDTRFISIANAANHSVNSFSDMGNSMTNALTNNTAGTIDRAASIGAAGFGAMTFLGGMPGLFWEVTTSIGTAIGIPSFFVYVALALISFLIIMGLVYLFTGRFIIS